MPALSDRDIGTITAARRKVRIHELPAIAEQLAKLDAKLLNDELREYGAWNDDERADHSQNLQRILWCAVCDLHEEYGI